MVKQSRRLLDPQRLVSAGLRHELAGMKCEQIAQEMDTTNGTVSRWVRASRRFIQEASDYARISAVIAQQALAKTDSQA